MLLGWLAAACRCSVALAASAMQFPACLAAASAVLAPHRLICSSISYKYNNSQCYHGAVRTCHVSTLHLQNHDICCLRPPPFRVTVPPHCTVWRIGRLQMAEPQICRSEARSCPHNHDRFLGPASASPDAPITNPFKPAGAPG